MAMKILPLSDVRNRLPMVLRELEGEGTPCFVTRNGRAVAAFLSMDTYERLMSELEDRLDETDEQLAQDVAEARRQYRAGHSTTLKTSRR